MNNEMLNSETRELTIGELDAVTGGAGVIDTIVQVVKKVAQVITGTTGVCTEPLVLGLNHGRGTHPCQTNRLRNRGLSK